MSQDNIARSSSLMASGTMLSRALGFVKAIVLATAIGVTSSVAADAFTLANLLPSSVYMLLVGGALSSIFVPQISRALTKKDQGAAYINKLVTISTLFLLGITTVAMIAAPFLVYIYSISWSSDERALAIAFAYWCLPQIFFYGLFNIFGEVLNAKKVFGPASWAPVLNNIISIVGLVIYIAIFGSDPSGNQPVEDWTPFQIGVLGASATLGVVTQALILLVAWRKAGIKYRPDFAWRGVGLGKLGKIAQWSLATVVVMQLGGIVTNNVALSASGKAASIAALQYAWLIFLLPYAIFAFSIGTAYFTRFAEHVHNNDLDKIRTDVSSALRIISLVMAISGAVIFITAPFISTVVMDGATPTEIAELALVIAMYILCLVPYGMWFVIQRTYFAFEDTRTPFFFTLLQVILFAGGSLLALVTTPVELLAAMMALTFSVTTYIQVTVALFFLSRKLNGLDGRRVFVSHLKYAVALVPTLIAGYGLWLFTIDVINEENFLLAILESVVYAIIMTSIYLGTLLLLKSEEVRELASLIKRKLGR